MSHKHVSNKATLQNAAFLSKLGSTLAGRVAPEVDTRSNIQWHKTSQVTQRIKTATGTIAVYEDMTEEQVTELQEQAAMVGEGDVVNLPPSAAADAIFDAAKAAADAGVTTQPLYLATEDYTPDDSEGLTIVKGQKLFLVDSSSPHKRAKVEEGSGEEEVQLLDNSAARHKMAIRPKKHHPDPRSRAQEAHDERWMMRDAETDKEGLVPSSMLESAPEELVVSTASSTKRSIQKVNIEETVELKKNLMQEVRLGKMLKKSSSRGKAPPEDESSSRRAATVRELIETEEEFARDLKFVMLKYYEHMEGEMVPRHIKDQKELIFNNFKFIADFHQNVLIEGVKYNAEVPRMIGKTFTRLERDFDKHAEYCSNEPLAQEFLENNLKIKEYFEEYSQQLGDDKRLQDHLKLPIQRLNDYQLLIKELIKYSSRLGDDVTDLQKALELMQTLPQRATDTKFISSIEGFKGNLFKLGRLIRHDWWNVSEIGHKPHDRYLFLFKARILVTKVKKISDDRSVFVLKDIIRLPETALGDLDRERVLEFHHIEPHNHPNYPIVIEAKNTDIRDAWLSSVQEHVVDTASVEDLLFDDEIRVVSLEADDDDHGVVSPTDDKHFVIEDLPLDTKTVGVKQEQTKTVVKAVKEQKTPEQVDSKKISAEQEVAKDSGSKATADQDNKVDKAKEEQEKKKKLEEEEKKKKEQQDTIKKAEVEKKQKEEEQKKKVEEVEKKKKEEEEKKKKELEDKKKKEEDDKLKKLADEKKKKEEEEKVKKEAEAKKLKEEEEKKKKVEEDKKKRAEEIIKKAELEQKNKEELEKKKKEEEAKKKKEDEEKIKKELEAKKAQEEADKKKKEDEAKKKKEEEAKKKQEDEAKKKLEDESKKKLEEETKKKKAEEEKKKVEESKKKAEEEKKKVEESKKKAEEEKKKAEESKKKAEAEKKKSDLESSAVDEEFDKIAKEAAVESTQVDEFWKNREPSAAKAKAVPVVSKPQVTATATATKPTTTPSAPSTKDTITTPTKTLVKRDEKPKLEVKTDLPLAKPAKMAEPGTPATPGTGPRPIYTRAVVGDVVEPGDGAQFICEVRHPSSYYVQWLKDNNPLDDKLADRVKQIDAGHRHILKVLNCRVEDSGLYTAKATDEGNNSATCSAQLLVHDMTEAERQQKQQEKSPFFMVKMKPTEVIENTFFSTAVHVKGDPMPEVAFFKDDKDLVEDDRIAIKRDTENSKYWITFTHIVKTDAGKYKCLAKNKFGRAECEATLNVTDELVALEHLAGKGSLLKPGEKAEFKWFRDGVEYMDPLERFNVMFRDDEDTLALVFQNVTPEDAGLYTCVASTSCGKISCSAELTVEGQVNRLLRDPEEPSVKQGLEDSSVAVGTTAMLECKIGGYPKPDLKWTKSSLDIEMGGRIKLLWEDEETVSLVIKNVTEKDAGMYRVVAKNELGSADCDCKLSIRAGPKIKSMKKEVACKVGVDLDYVVEVEGEPTPVVRWQKDGKDISANDRISFKQSADKYTWTMHIKSMTLQDCGIYTVIASNDIGSRSEQFTVEADAPPVITKPLEAETEKKMGYDCTFEVRCTGSPRPLAVWTKNGKTIENDDKFKMTQDDTFYMLKMRNLDRKDKGVYKLELENTSGKASTEGSLVIRAPPDFKTPLRDACAKEGTKECKMFCEWEANPKPSVKVFFNDKPIREETPGWAIKVTETSLLINILEATAEFCGVYTIKATNEYGDSSCSAKFRLHEAPAIVEPLKDVEFLEESADKITFKATGIPIPDIKWTKDGKKWTPDDRRVKSKKEGEEIYILTVDDCNTEDTAVYAATLTNVEGSVTTEAKITVNTPPHITKCNFQDGKTFVAMHKFILEVEAHATPEATATWYFNGTQVEEEDGKVRMSFDGKKYILERIGCDPVHSGEYKCVLYNKIKDNFVLGNVNVIEKEARVRQPLENVFIRENMDAELKCQIVGDPIPTVEWLRNGKPLPPSERFQIREERENRMHYLVFKEVSERDKSSFTVRAKNQHGSCETTCQLGILVKPVPGELKDTTVDYDKTLHIDVIVHAFPPPQMKWFLNHKELADCEHSKYLRDEDKELYSLIVSNAVLEDAGKYMYVASNAAGEASHTCEVKVHTEPPAVKRKLEETEVCLEDDAVIQLVCTGLPLPEVEWRNKGMALKPSSKYIIENPQPGVYQLTIKNVDSDDYGNLQAVARSLVGEASSVAQFKQKMLPCEIVQALENVTKGAEGDDVNLTVRIRASPRPAFCWLKDGTTLETSANISMEMVRESFCEASVSLTLMEAGAMSSGQYRMKITNPISEAHSETALIVRPVRRKPKISRKPEDLEVTEKNAGKFQAKVVGFPRPDVKWLKDGRLVRQTDLCSSGTTADGFFFLEFKQVSMEDAGRYTLQASNEEGSTECDFTLIVNPPPAKPEFLAGLKPVKVINGYPCKMEVKLGGFPLPTPTWLKDGKPLEVDGSHYRVSVSNDGLVALIIDNATDADQGSYTCVAKNNEGESESHGKLAVLGNDRTDGQPDGAPKLTETLKDQCFDEGKTIRLPVAIKGGPIPAMKWYKNGKEINVDNRTFYTYDGDRAYLEIRPCAGDDSGVYKCVLTNDFGTTETECEISVRKCFEPPSFSSAYINQVQIPGRDVKFTIRVDGVPKPEINWYHDGQLITPDGEKYKIRKDGDTTTLYVRDTTYSDSGKWKVEAKNREGTIEHTAELLVDDNVDPARRVEAPVFLKAIGDQELYEGYTARFKAIVSGKPLPEFQWLKNGVLLLPTNRIIPEVDNDGMVRLTIKYVTVDDSGVYELKAVNPHGNASSQGKLICESLTSLKKRPVGDEYQGFDKIRRSGVPMPLPERPFISALGDKRVTVSWLPYLAQGPCTPVTYQVEMLECPEGDWFTVRSGIRGSSVDISNLASKSDYKFRVRVENKYGVSEPSPYVLTYRNKMERVPLNYEPVLELNKFDHGEGPYVPSGFMLNRDIRGNFFAAPRFLRLPYDTQYGMKNFNARIRWCAFGYPNPRVSFHFREREIEVTPTGKYTMAQEATGEITLYIDKMTEDDVGWYDCVVSNEYGESHQRIRLSLAEYPRVVEHLKEMTMRVHGTGKIAVRIAGHPPCEVTWYKDWERMQPTFRIKAQFVEPDMYVLNFHGATIRDNGLYSVAAANVAGTVTSCCFVHVEDDEHSFTWTGPGKGRVVEFNARRGTLENHYDIGDELGRGTQGVIYHVVEHFTGKNFAAKSMWGKEDFKMWMMHEFEMMNLLNTSKHIVRLYDAYESYKNVMLVTELCSGGDLLWAITQQQYTTEYEIAYYIKQVLEAMEYIHDRYMAHLGLNIGDILMTHLNSRELKICDLSLARPIRNNKMYALDYGMPEFVAPEVANGQVVSYPADMWAIGVITYLLLSGSSPFRGENDRETLTKVQKGEMSFDMAAFMNISDEAKDFIAKLLQFRPDMRMDIKSALCHPWMRYAETQPRDPKRINTDKLKTYYFKYREWYANASCRRWFRRRTLSSAFTHPSKMVYPPGEVYTPPESPERDLAPVPIQDDFSIPHRDLSFEIGDIKSDSHYQQGPDTYLLQLRDVDFPVRLRQYMKVAAARSPSFAANIRENNYDYQFRTDRFETQSEIKTKESEKKVEAKETIFSLREKYDQSTYDYCCRPSSDVNIDKYIKIPVVHERRRFTDIMDEEIDDERKRTIVDKYTAEFIRVDRALKSSLEMPKRVKDELPSSRRAFTEGTTDLNEMIIEGKAPFMREKPGTTSIILGRPVSVTAVFTADPEPAIQWNRNDMILNESENLKIETCLEEGKTTLTIPSCTTEELGLYKVIVRNMLGQAVHRFRIVLGVIPGVCESPEITDVSDTEVLLKWKVPYSDGGSPAVCYHVQVKPQDENSWTTVAENIEHEFYLVRGLRSNFQYQFRVAARNVMGWGEFSVASVPVKTAIEGTKDKISTMTPSMSHQQNVTDSGHIVIIDDVIRKEPFDYTKETDPLKLKSGDGAELQAKKYSLVHEIARGQFSQVSRAIRSDDQRTFAAKVLVKAGRQDKILQEFNNAKSLRHERLATLYEAYDMPNLSVFIMEYLPGEVDVLTYLAEKLEYNEQCMITIIRQILDGLSYLHWRGLCHLDIQPDNVVMSQPRSCGIKLVDFGSAHPVSILGSDVPFNGLLDYIAPEVIFDKKAYPNSDVWSLGVLTYVLMAGVSPFLGIDDKETKDNINCVRYRFEWLEKSLTQEATRFLMLIFKRDPSKRPTVEECINHSWLAESDFMVKKRERAVMQSFRLHDYASTYHANRKAFSIHNKEILNFGKKS